MMIMKTTTDHPKNNNENLIFPENELMYRQLTNNLHESTRLLSDST